MRHYGNRAALVGVLLLVAWASLPAPGASSDDRHRVRLLHSYDPAYAWTRQVDQGIAAALETPPQAPRVRTSTYYEVQGAVVWGSLAAAVGLIMLLAALVITTRTKLLAARALRRSTDQLNLALEAAHAGIWTADLRTNEIFLSPQWFSILGYEPDAFPHSTRAWFDLVHPEDGRRTLEVYREFQADPQKDFSAEFRMRTQNGEWRWLLSTGRVSASDAHGKPQALIGIHLDITARKLAEDALATSERRYRDMFNEAPVMYVITRVREGMPIIIDANDLFLKKLGYALHEVVGQELGRFYTEQSRWDLLAGGGYRRALEGHYLDEERHLVTRGGQVLHTLLRSLAERDETGRVIGTRAMFLDVSARRQAEEEAQRLSAALEQAQKMESIGTLAGGIAHDFNNILAGIMGYAELALADAAPENPQRGMLEAILHGGQRARDLVRQILTFSRQDQREPKPLELGPVVVEALQLMRSSLPSTIEIRQEIAADLGHVLADPTHIHQILMNLCANAAYAMEEAGGVLQVDLDQVALGADDRQRYPELPPGDYLRLRVSDNGCGMPAHFLKHIFEPYFTTKEQGQGTGLGLAVVHGLVKGYGGGVTVTSAPGRGTTFAVLLPCRQEAGAPTVEADSRLPGGRERILLVDDEPFVLDIARQMLSRLGYAVETCTNGAQALERFHATPAAFDLVISDMTMPGLTGDRLAAELERIRPDIPVILCTGFSQRLMARDRTCAAVKTVLTKPLRYADLAQEVRKALSDSGNTPPHAPAVPGRQLPGAPTGAG